MGFTQSNGIAVQVVSIPKDTLLKYLNGKRKKIVFQPYLHESSFQPQWGLVMWSAAKQTSYFSNMKVLDPSTKDKPVLINAPVIFGAQKIGKDNLKELLAATPPSGGWYLQPYAYQKDGNIFIRYIVFIYPEDKGTAESNKTDIKTNPSPPATIRNKGGVWK